MEDGDIAYDQDAHAHRTFAGSNWGSIATFQDEDLISQTGSITETVLVVDPLAAVYRVTALVLCTSPASGNSVVITAKWRDSLGLHSDPIVNADLSHSGRSVGELVLRAFAGSPSTPISFLSTMTGSGSEYNLYVRAERL